MSETLISVNFNNSSNLASADYELHSQELTVRFHSGAVYKYFDIPKVVADELMASLSPGNYLATYIKGAYRYEGEAQAVPAVGSSQSARELIERAAAAVSALPEGRGRSMVLTKLDEAHLWLTRVK